MSMHMPRLLLPVLAFTAILLAGCSSKPPAIVPVSGVVKLNGIPLAKAEVRFYPTHEGLSGDYIAIAITDDDGKFTLETNGQSGGCACAHRVTVSEGPPPKEARGETPKAQMAYAAYAATLKNRPIPTKYATLAESPLTITITPGQSDYPIDLTR